MSSTPRPKWIIDCDPGCDDAVALALAAQKLPQDARVEVLTVAGNVSVDLTTWNARRVIAECQKQWKVHRGCGRSLSGEAVPAASVHGRDGLGDIPIGVAGKAEPPSKLPPQFTAVRRLRELVEGAAPFVIVCTGPLTNLATAFNLMSASQHKAFWDNCQSCVIMGGSFRAAGNITTAAEFNCHFDPVALQAVLESWRAVQQRGQDSKIYFVTLDVTETVGIPIPNPADHTHVPGETSPAAVFLGAALRKYGQFHARFCQRPQSADGKNYGIAPFKEDNYLRERVKGASGAKYLAPFCYLHDPLAVWAALNLDGKAKDVWVANSISVDAVPGPNRGRILIHKGHSDSPTRLLTLGTKVKWMDPNRFTPLQNEFVNEIKTLLGMQKADGKNGN